MSETQRDSFRQILGQIAELAARHPDYRFEHIDSYIRQLGSGDSKPWIEAIDKDFQQLPPARQEACQQLFEYALLRARQTTYRPVNDLDAFLERQFYGIEDDQVIQKSAVSQALKQIDDRRRIANSPAPQPGPQAGPPPGPPPGPQGQALPQVPLHPPAARPAPAAGRTNPLNPRQIPKGGEGDPKP